MDPLYLNHDCNVATQTLRLDDAPSGDSKEEDDPFQATTFEVCLGTELPPQWLEMILVVANRNSWC